MDGKYVQWHWTSYGWEKQPFSAHCRHINVGNLYAQSLQRPQNTRQGEILGSRQSTNRHGCPAVAKANGRLGALNARAKLREGFAVDSEYSIQRATSPRNINSSIEDHVHNTHVSDTNLEEMAEMCLSTSVLPSILLHEKLRKSDPRDSSLLGYESDNSSLLCDPDYAADCYRISSDKLYIEENVPHEEREVDSKSNYQREPSSPFGAQINIASESYVAGNYTASEQYQIQSNIKAENGMTFLDDNNLIDENLVDDLWREIDDSDDIDECNASKEQNESFRNDAETEAERMKRQLSLMGRY